MEAKRAIEIFQLHVRQRTDLDNPGIINEDVDLAEVLEGLLNGRLHLGGLEQVALDSEHFSSESIQIGFGAFEFFGIAGKQRDFAATRANLASDLQAETA